MKNRIQKPLCLLIAAVLLATGLIISPSAELTGSEKATTIQGNLTAHWDFEGDTLEEQLKDKAPKGSTNDDLVIKSSTNGITIANGVANLLQDKTTALWLNMSSGTSDVRLTEKTTIFAKFRFTGKNSGHADILQMEGLYRIFRHTNGSLRIILPNVKQSGTQLTLIANTNIASDQDIYFAFVSNADTTANTFKAAIYLSNDGVTYTKTSFEYTENLSMTFGSGRGTSQTHGLYIGNNRLMADQGLDYEFDDIRIYNKSFSDHEITQITRLDPMAPVVIGSQETAPAGDLQSIRLISAIQSADYTEAGYTVKVRYNNGTEDVEKTLSKACTAVYRSLTADEGEGIVEISAETLGGSYLLALTIDKVPCSKGKIELEVTAYAVDADGRHESIPVLFTYENGAFVSAVRK